MLGGAPVAGIAPPGARVVQLPPAIASDAQFTNLLDEHGNKVDERWKVKRKQALLDAFDAAKPDIVLLEMYPFGRRQFRFELLPLLDLAAAPFPAGGRGLGARHPGGQGPHGSRARSSRHVNQHVDQVLHGDPNLTRLDLTFRWHPTSRTSSATPVSWWSVGGGRSPGRPRRWRGPVSAGGGAVGSRRWRRRSAPRADAPSSPALAHRDRRQPAGGRARAAGQARGRRSRHRDRRLPWRFRLAARHLPPVGLARRLQHGDGTRSRPAAPRWWCRSRKALGESEQTLRARMLVERQVLTMVDPEFLTAGTLAAAIDGVRPPAELALNLDGARQSAAQLIGAWKERR